MVENALFASYLAEDASALISELMQRYVSVETLTYNLTSFQNLTMLGINATADATNKLSVNSAAILFNNIGNDMQVKINKNAAGDKASFLFQTGFSARAEFGLLGDDNFTLKVSPDGSSFFDAFKMLAASDACWRMRRCID